MSLLITIANRLEKVTGVFVKTLAYPIHFVLPKKRFTIPLVSKAKIKIQRPTKIPKIIWQTNYTNKVAFPVYVNYLFNRLLSLDYEYRHISTEDRLDYIKTHANLDTYQAYSRLTDGASQADFWRLFVLNKEGGIYMDIDAHLVWPLSRMIEQNDTEIFLLNKQHFTNYFIATTPNNSILEKSIQIIVNNIQDDKLDRGVYELTGPGVLNIAIGDKQVKHRFYSTTCIQGSFTNEYFQYLDKPRGKWTHAKTEDLIK